jgi:aspartyl-tRNA(Asn)/glutamyl-tRNA(Gln) amidotransferase subunit B
MSNYTPIIGLEIHVEPTTKSKMFCGCPADHFGVEPNTHVCPVCFGLPGALPVANVEGIRRTIKIGLALDSDIASHSKFDRKNYFYPDLPKGYQISQYDEPLCEGGEVPTSEGPVRITRVHLEEDTAKIQHVTLTPEEQAQAGVSQPNVSLIDFNRSGVPLIEIVTEPDMHSAAHAREFAKNLVHILRYLDISDCDMEKGALRLEANISVQSDEEKAAGKLPDYKVEVKNLNSFRFLERAINYEIKRHVALREKGELPKQETRGWNDPENRSYSQRSKETAEDYRYFPDPDLPELEIDANMIEQIAEQLPELPYVKQQRFITQYGVSVQNAEVMTSERRLAEVVEVFLVAVQNAGVDCQKAANAVVNRKVATWLLDTARLGMANSDEVSAEIERVLPEIVDLYQVDEVSDVEIQQAVDMVLSDPANAKAVADFKSGEQKVLGFLMGQVLRQLGKKVEASRVIAMIRAYENTE